MTNTIIKRFSYIAVIILIAAGLGLAQTEPEPSTQSERPICYHETFSAFAFLESEWEVNANSQLADGTWEASMAASQIKHDLSGCILMERLIRAREGRPFTFSASLLSTIMQSTC